MFSARDASPSIYSAVVVKQENWALKQKLVKSLTFIGGDTVKYNVGIGFSLFVTDRGKFLCNRNF